MTESSPHLSLYRRWRSQTFAEVVGQEDVVRTLRNAVVAQEAAHAYLFAGERGVGKTSVARILSRAVNCLQPRSGEPCNECANCRTILSGRSLDIVEIDGASNRGIDHIRKLREEVNFVPADLRMKVYIIDEVHMLTNEAFNALLKTLEEPPAHAMFVFATTEPHKLPRTIVSRCQAFEFRRLPIDKICGHLRRVSEAEGITLEDGACDLIARRANGGMRDALVMLEQAASHEAGPITEAAVLDMLGLAGRDTHEAFVTALEAADRAAVLATTETLVERGKDLDLFLADVVGLLRERILQGGASAPAAVRMAQGLLDVKADLFRALDRQIRLEVGVLALIESLATSLPATTPHEPTDRPARSAVTPKKAAVPRSGTTSASATAPVPAQPHEKPRPAATSKRALSVESESTPPAATPTLPPELEARWTAMLHEVEKDRIAVAAYLTEATPSVDGARLVLSFHPEHTFHKESLEKHENLQYLAGTARRHFGDAFYVEVQFDENVIRKPLPRDALLEKARLVCEVFDGKIVKEAL
ncbi:MAG: DNA polymerase III subunit gamma/tau [Candidatus Bipolaricaulis sp.]|nr:DNA polymerase III subunit gamma/tau [Candidatus Bipolaricaulis sp.]MDD5645644.1 DNA polymerase III subunit gamma/tau [Candidatus Bipolaricaulis sp.]